MLAIVCLMALPESTHFSSTENERGVYLPSQPHTLYSAKIKLWKIIWFTLVFWTVTATAEAEKIEVHLSVLRT